MVESTVSSGVHIAYKRIYGDAQGGVQQHQFTGILNYTPSKYLETTLRTSYR